MTNLRQDSFIGIDFAHHELHEGEHFYYQDPITLGSAATQDYLITTPNTDKLAHMIRILDGTAVTTFELFEGSDRTGTTLQTARNRYRDNATAAGVTIHKGTSGGATDGTSIAKYSSGTASGAVARNPTADRGSVELILKKDTKYILRVTSGTAGNLINVLLDWYEHSF